MDKDAQPEFHVREIPSLQPPLTLVVKIRQMNPCQMTAASPRLLNQPVPSVRVLPLVVFCFASK